jgi:Flp pilus assembly protein TadG
MRMPGKLVGARRADSGATAVEFALLFPVFMMLAIGTISFGFAFESWINVTQASREASRFAATYPMPSGGVSPWLDDVTAVAKEAGGIDAATPLNEYLVCVRFVNQVGPAPSPATTLRSSGTLSGATCPASTSTMPDNRAEVTVVQEAGLQWILGSASVKVSGDNVSRYEPRLDP